MSIGPDEVDPGDELVQCNIRIPRRLRDQIDERRAALPDGKISRDKWMARALKWALAQPVASPRRARRTIARNTRGRTAAGASR